jgi:tRNA U38,U39,U40 pseudouridine synthase TruA
MFVGEHWFHNFIGKKNVKDYSTKKDAFNSFKREILEFKIDDLVTLECDGS